MSNLILPPGSSAAPYLHTNTSSKVRRFRNFAYWAEGGRIWFENVQNGTFETCSLETFKNRIKLFEQGVERIKWNDEAAEVRKMLLEANDVIQEAQNQGDPHDPVVLNEKLRSTPTTRQHAGFEYVTRPLPEKFRDVSSQRQFVTGKPGRGPIKLGI